MSLFDVVSRQRRLVLLAVGGLSAAGAWAALRIPSAIYPELVFPRIAVVVTGAALGARQMVFSVTRPIEEALGVVQGVTRVRSRTIRGATEISVSFAPSADMQFALQQTQARVAEARTLLPPGLDIQVERLTPAVFPILSYNFQGGDAATLYDVARYRLKPVLSRIPGVARVEVQGAEVRELEVVADPGQLAARGMTYDDLAAAIRAGTTPQAVGRVVKDYRQYLAITDREARSPDDIADLTIRPGVRVRDVASVSMATEDRVRLVTGDGQPAALINISRQPGASTIAVADSVAEVMASFGPTLPPGATLKVVYDQAELVRDSVRAVRDAMIVGAVLAVIVLLIFLRQAVITAISAAVIPLTMLLTVFVMYLAGQTFNLMTLGAMAVAIGLVIDDAVVVVENISRHLTMGVTPRRALRDALQELIWPVTTSTITSVVVFLPLGLLQGVVGQFFIALSITLTIAVVVSLVLAFTLIPLLTERFVEAIVHAESRHGATNPEAGRGAVFARVAAAYGRSLEWLLERRWLAAGATALLLVGGGIAARTIGTGFLPVLDEGAFVMDYFTPGGTALQETDRELRIAERILLRIPEIEGISRRTGAELGLFATGQNTGDLVARLAPHRRRSRDIFAVIDQARSEIGAAVPRLRVEFIQILSDIINDLAGNPSPVEIKLFGERLDTLDAYARRLAPQLAAVPGLVDVFNGVSEPSPEMLIRIRDADAARAGLTAMDVGSRVAGALLGVSAGEVRLEDRAVSIRVRAPDRVRQDPDRVVDLPMTTGGGRTTSLGALAAVRTVESRGELMRENQRQMIAMTGQVADRALGDVTADVQAVLARTGPPIGVTVEMAGQAASQRDAFRELLLVMLLAGVCVTAVMVVQFTSFVEPLVVLLAAPLSFVGALGLLLAAGVPLNVSSLMGLILLVGLIVKNGIILLDFAHHRMRDGLSLAVAIREAAEVRLRPILMTTLCTLFGLLPLALGIGAGSELQRPLALAVIGGLALSTPITLYLVPAVLVAVRGAGWRPQGARQAEDARSGDA